MNAHQRRVRHRVRSRREMRVRAALMRISRHIPFATFLPPMTFRYGNEPMISHPGWSRGCFIERRAECIVLTAR